MLHVSRIDAIDRRLAAVHEAGHLVIADELGVLHAGAEIWRTPQPEMNEKRWIGVARVACAGLPIRARAMIGVAGVVAKKCWQFKFYWRSADIVTPTDDAWAYEWDDPNFMSSTDWETAGCEPGEPNAAFRWAVEEDFNLLEGVLWPKLVRQSRWLIQRFGG